MYSGILSSEQIAHSSIEDPSTLSLVESLAVAEADTLGVPWLLLEKRTQDEILAFILRDYFTTIIPIIDSLDDWVH